MVLAGHLFNATPREAVPLSGDEVAYWNQIAAFSRAGMQGGYQTINEEPSRSGFSRFGPHGPAFPMIYGTLGRVFGWRPYSAPLISMVLVALAGAWWCARVHCGWWGALTLATFWPLILVLPSTMQEPLHFAIGIALAGAIAAGLSSESDRVSGAAVVSCLVAGLLRPTWAFVAIPVAWAATRSRPAATRWLVVAAVGGAAALVGLIFGWLAAPFPGAVFSASDVRSMSLLMGMSRRLGENAYQFIVPVEADAMEVFVRYATLAMLTAAAVAMWRRRRMRTDRELFVVMVVGLIVVAVLLGGSVERWRDFRVLAPTLLLALLVWLPGGTALPRAIVIANVAAAPLGIATFHSLHAARFAPQIKTEYVARSIANVISFAPGADPWQNTVLMHVDAVDPALVALPHGIGLSVTFAWEDITLPPHSRYLLLRPRDVEEVTPQVDLRLLTQTPLGGLYENVRVVQSAR